MSKITAEMVKELRERSGVGMGKCKEALVESDGDMQKAIEFLRKKGLASAVKKADRETKEGVIAYYETDNTIAVVEINSETDFVAKNEKFQNFAKEISIQAANNKPSSLESFSKEKYVKDKSLTIDEYRNLLIQSIGENIQISKLEIIHKEKNTSYGIYSHLGGKIVTIVEISGSKDEQNLAKDIAMHVACENPEYLKEDQIPETVIKKEEEIARSQVKNKPDFVVEKIVQGKIKAYQEQVCLLNQKFIKDTDISIETLVKNRSKEINKELKLTCFWRWQIGS